VTRSDHSIASTQAEEETEGESIHELFQTMGIPEIHRFGISTLLMKADVLNPFRCRESFRSRFAGPVGCLSLVLFVAVVTPEVTPAELRTGNTYGLTVTDVDQHQLSTSDGHVTIITVVTRKDEQKAQAVGDRFPAAYLGDPRYRLITVVNFQQKLFSAFRGLALSIIRHRVDLEAKELQKVYSAKQLNRNPRSDLFVVADFDGKTVSQLGITPLSTEFAVFAFAGNGRLVRRWNDAPSADALLAAMKEAQ